MAEDPEKRGARSRAPSPSLGTPSGPEGADFAAEIVDRLASRGTLFGRYRLLGELARGGQGAILRVWDEDLRRNLAMKVVAGRPQFTGETTPLNSRTLGRFLEEAQVTAQLDHPGIVPVHELGLDSQGQIYFTMKLVKGQDLKTVFDLVHEERDGWTMTRAVNVLLKVCEAMAYAHSKGVIHRDLKPANVMVGPFGEVYVMDWGLAKVLGKEDRRDIRIQPEHATTLLRSVRGEAELDSPLITMDGDIVGTPVYMSPEQAAGDLEAMGPHSDVYSLGAMLYQLLTRQVPFTPPGARLNNYFILGLLQTQSPTSIQELAPNAPVELTAICEKAMARRPEDRYADMQDFAQDILAYLEGRVVRAHRTGPVAEAVRWVRRNKAIASTVGVALLSIFAVSVAFFVTDRNRTLAQAAERDLRADRFRLPVYLEETESLWPAHPEMFPSFRDWLVKARDLAARRPEHQELLLWIRAGVDGFGEAPEGPAEREDWEEARRRAREDLTAQGKLVAGLVALTDPETGAIAEVQGRIDLVKELQERTLSGPAARESWRTALASIADPVQCPAYRGLQLEPQFGLLPLGKDAESGLWEFAHLQTGEVPERGDDNRIVPTEAMGIVFVLLPGGTFLMGAQRTDPGVPNYDPNAWDQEGPVHEVTLSPFFVSKYEMTQGQWVRFTGDNPSRDTPESYRPSWNADGREGSLVHPVEAATWVSCTETLEQLGLRLPSEAQWEYAARAGTDTVWWTGDEPESLIGVANLADGYAQEHYGQDWNKHELWLDDGQGTHAPVGSYAPNPFGLFDIVGNLWEFCHDGFAEDFYQRSPDVDPVSDPAGSRRHPSRGGSFLSMALRSRSAVRGVRNADGRSGTVGVRPVLPVAGPFRFDAGAGK